MSIRIPAHRLSVYDFIQQSKSIIPASIAIMLSKRNASINVTGVIIADTPIIKSMLKMVLKHIMT